MSDTDSIKTDRSVTDLQQKYDKLAMEFAKVNFQFQHYINLTTYQLQPVIFF